VFACRSIVLKVGESEALGPFVLSVFDDGHRETGDMSRGHEFGDGIDLAQFAGREFALSYAYPGKDRDKDREANPVGTGPVAFS